MKVYTDTGGLRPETNYLKHLQTVRVLLLPLLLMKHFYQPHFRMLMQFLYRPHLRIPVPAPPLTFHSFPIHVCRNCLTTARSKSLFLRHHHLLSSHSHNTRKTKKTRYQTRSCHSSFITACPPLQYQHTPTNSVTSALHIPILLPMFFVSFPT